MSKKKKYTETFEQEHHEEIQIVKEPVQQEQQFDELSFIKMNLGLNEVLNYDDLTDKIRDIKRQCYIGDVALGKITLGIEPFLKDGVHGLINYVQESYNQCLPVLAISHSSKQTFKQMTDLYEIKKSYSLNSDYNEYLVSKSNLLYVLILNMSNSIKKKQNLSWEEFFGELKKVWDAKETQEYKTIQKQNGNTINSRPIYAQNEFGKVQNEIQENWKITVQTEVKKETKKIVLFK